MCYLLIGNISALISDECTEPLVNARIRVYLPDAKHPNSYPRKNVFIGPIQLTAADVAAKQERLLAEAALDDRGNFTLSWEQIHLFTEPLELDICLQGMPGQTPQKPVESYYHLSTLIPQWKRSLQRYVAAYAYVIPVESWAQILASYGTWVIAGIVRRTHSKEGQSQLRVEAYNAGNRRLLACSSTDDKGRYQIRFSRKQLSGKRLFAAGRFAPGPDVYFKVYSGNKLVWEEEAGIATMPGRRSIPACTVINITMQQSLIRRAKGYVPEWLSSWVVQGKRTSVAGH